MYIYQKTKFTLIERVVACKPTCPSKPWRSGELPVKGRRSIQRAFTLIELLIVIGIIAVLTTILLPSLQVAKWRTKITACINQEKQIGYALISYANDFNSRIPGWNYYKPERLSIDGVKQNAGPLVPDYIGFNEARILYCPAAHRELRWRYDNSDNANYNFVNQFPNGPTGTGMHYYYRGGDIYPANVLDKSLHPGFSLAKTPSGTAILADTFAHTGTGTVGARTFYLNHTRGGQAASFKGLNVLYLDGHAKWFTMKYAKLSQLDPIYGITGTTQQDTWDYLNEN